MKLSLPALGLLAVSLACAPAIAQNLGSDMNTDRQNIRNDANAVHQEGTAIQNERSEYLSEQKRLNEELKERAAAQKRGDKESAAQAQHEIDRLKSDIYRNRMDIMHNEAKVDAQHQDMARQKDDLRKDMNNLPHPKPGTTER